jgi:phenylpyruvate tautomerase PptA (4-oxalocrotonate tautomerase family)
MVDVDAKKASTNILIEEVEKESAIANVENEAATKEEE